jgi:branched-chain amino acid transport system ATP-binding protein
VAATVLEGVGLRKYFGSVRAVDGVTLRLREAEVLGIVGPNGAGKTTLLNILSGVLKPDAGRVLLRLGGRVVDVTGWPPARLASYGVARAFQIPSVFENMSVIDNVRAAVVGRMRLYARTLKPYDGGLREVDEEAWSIMEFLGLEGKAYTLARDLSHGDRKLLDIALALALRPRVLLLDEPTAGLSAAEKQSVTRLVARLREEKRVSVILVEHDLDVVFAVSDRVMVMYEGRVLAEGDPDAVKRDEGCVGCTWARGRRLEARCRGPVG